MTDPFLAEIRVFGGNFAPSGWALCNGQVLPIVQNTALFSLLGTTYGGNGSTTFGLPNLMGSTPVQQGQGPGLSQRVLGEVGGAPTVTLAIAEMPQHTHAPLAADSGGTSTSPANAVWAQTTIGRQATRMYSTAAPDVTLDPTSIQAAGGGQPHNNMPPFLCLTFIIALQGIFPPRP